MAATKKKRQQPQLQDNAAQKVAARMAQRRSGENVQVASTAGLPVSQPRPIVRPGQSAIDVYDSDGRRPRPNGRPSKPTRPGRSNRVTVGPAGGRPAGTPPPTQTAQGGLDTGRRPKPPGVRQPPTNKVGDYRNTSLPLKDRQVKNRLTNQRQEHQGERAEFKELKAAGPSEALTKFRDKLASLRYARQEADKRGIRPKPKDRNEAKGKGKGGQGQQGAGNSPTTGTPSDGYQPTPPTGEGPTPKSASPGARKPGEGPAGGRRAEPRGSVRRRRPRRRRPVRG